MSDANAVFVVRSGRRSQQRRPRLRRICKAFNGGGPTEKPAACLHAQDCLTPKSPSRRGLGQAPVRQEPRSCPAQAWRSIGGVWCVCVMVQSSLVVGCRIGVLAGVQDQYGRNQYSPATSLRKSVDKWMSEHLSTLIHNPCMQLP